MLVVVAEPGGQREMDRSERLSDLGWKQPVDHSPVKNPPGWDGGAVFNTGGHVFCRIWKRELSDGSEFEVLYNGSNPGVGLQWLPADDNAPELLFEIKVNEASDQLMSEAALMLMLYTNFAYSVEGDK
jgi:hypothetical protein